MIITKRVLIYSFIILFFAALQGTVFHAIDFLGNVPLLCLEIVVFVAMLRGVTEGALVGAAMGLVCDVVSSGRVGGNALLFMWIGLAAGYVCSTYFQTGKQVALIFAMISVAAYGVLYYFFGFLIRGEFNVIHVLWSVILPGIAYSAVVAVPLYVLIARVNRWIS